MELQLLVGSRFGDYLLQKLLGEGGMGAVFRGHHVHMKLDHAVKILRPDLADNDEFLARFFHEAHQGARLTHDHIVAIHYAGKAQVQTASRGKRKLKLPFLAMEYVKGQTLRRAARQNATRTLPAPLVAVAAMQTLDGLAYAHANGMVHRDIKPDNLMITAEGHLKIADFGLARDIEDATGLTATGMVLGTPAFMSLEQWDGQTVLDGRSDVYSLGVTMFQLLAGNNPFAGENPVVIFRKLMVGDVPQLADGAPSTDAAMCRLVGRMMAARREDRFPSAEAAREAIGNWLAGQNLDAAALRAELGALVPRPSADSSIDESGTGDTGELGSPRDRTGPVAVGAPLKSRVANLASSVTSESADLHNRETTTDSGAQPAMPSSQLDEISPRLDAIPRHADVPIDGRLVDRGSTRRRHRGEMVGDDGPFRGPLAIGLTMAVVGVVALVISFTGNHARWDNRPATDGQPPRIVDATGATIRMVPDGEDGLVPAFVRELPPIEPSASLTGDLFAVGAKSMDGLMRAWVAGFQRHQPGVKVALTSATASDAARMLAVGSAQVAPMSRPLAPAEVAEFQRAFGYAPTAVVVAIDVPVVAVHASNPLDAISLAELDAIFSTTRHRGHATAAATWGDVGLAGEWASRRIVPITREMGAADREFFAEMALMGGELRGDLDVAVDPATMMAAIAGNPAAMGYGSASAAVPGVKFLRISARAGSSDAASPTMTNVLNGAYPWSRPLWLVVAKPPGEPLPPLVWEFVRYALSREGQTAVARAGLWPVPPLLRHRELAALE